MRIQGGEPVEGPYFAKDPVKEGDGYLEFTNWLMKRAYFREIVHYQNGILEDIQNLSSSIDKINFFHRCWLNDKKVISRRYVSTELEYIFKVCRSIFDLLQEVHRRIWKRFWHVDFSVKKKISRNRLPTWFFIKTL